MNLLGECVFHKSFGIGVVSEQKEKIILVKFEKENELKKFSYPNAFGVFLELENKEFSEKMLEEKNLLKRRQVEAERLNTNELERQGRMTLVKRLSNEYGFEGFLHYTDVKNLTNIVRDGKLFSRNKANTRTIIDSADQDVLSKTPNYIMDYVRFYYKDKTPTFYRNEGIKVDNKDPHMAIPVALLFRDEIIYHRKTAFLSGCGGSKYSYFTEDIDEAAAFDWSNIFSRGPIYASEYDDDPYNREIYKWKINNKRNAEFLYKNEIDLMYLDKLIFRSQAELKTTRVLLGENSSFEMICDRSMFYCHNNFMVDYEIIENEKEYSFTVEFNEDPSTYEHELRINYKKNRVKIEQISYEKSFNRPRYSFKIIKESDEKITRMEYYINDYLSAIWLEESND
jgi:hypothetical protein